MPETYRVAVIGRTGRGDYGHGLDVAWKEIPQARLVAVADDDKVGLAAAVRRLGLERGYADYRQMLDEVRPDVVTIAPRWIDCHHAMILAAVEHGAHVFMEKPFCRTLAEADEVVAACERTHVKLAIATQTRYSPKLAAIDRLIAEGRLGRLLELRGRGKEDQRGGGEDLWVLGFHIMDLIRRFGGDPVWCLAQVEERSEPLGPAHLAEGAEGIGLLGGDTVRAMFGLPGSLTAYFNSRRAAAGKSSRFALQIFGTEGVLELQTGYLPAVKFLPDSGWSPGRSQAQWLDVSSAGLSAEEPLTGEGLHGGNVLAIRDLLAAIEEDRQPLAGVYEARAATEMIVAVFASHCARGQVALPLAERHNPLARLAAG